MLADTQIKSLRLEHEPANKSCGLMTERFAVPETFVSEFSGWPSISRTLLGTVRLSVEKATKFHVPSPNQGIDDDELDDWVDVVDEGHDLNREEEREGVV